MSDIAGYLKGIRAMISEHGHAVQHVAGTEAGELGWSYTIGLHESGLPELIIIGGLEVRGQQGALNDLAARLRSGDVLRVGERDPRVLEGFDVTYLGVADTTTDDFAVAVKLQSRFRALQVVWPDMENRFPWESGYSLPLTEQRLLGAAPR